MLDENLLAFDEETLAAIAAGLGDGLFAAAGVD